MKKYTKLVVFALIAVPFFGLFSQNAYAAIPNTFKDENFYECTKDSYIDTAVFKWQLSYDEENPPVETFDEYINTLMDEIDRTGLTAVQLGEITSLVCHSRNITDTTGLEFMTSLVALDLRDNALTSIDLSNNPNLAELNLEGNYITSINLSNNREISYLSIDSAVTIDIAAPTEENDDTLIYDLSGIKFIDNFNLYDIIYEKNPDTIRYDKEEQKMYSTDSDTFDGIVSVYRCPLFDAEELRSIHNRAVTDEDDVFYCVDSKGDRVGTPFLSYKLRLINQSLEKSVSTPDTGSFTGNLSTKATVLPAIGISLLVIAIRLVFCVARFLCYNIKHYGR
ncbi:MAG: hypothetical protein Q4F61_01260 [Candidatus Saccharibacteria bacterium]|nr:hypothetical protein [Candidatus Saccharibacteria bacterium]